MIAGQQVTDTLRLARPLGQGAMGSVWVADHLALKTQVAVKFISTAYAQNRGLVERFRREALAAAQIKSPHVVQVFDHGVTPDGAPYIVMELLEGEDLKRRLERLGALPPPEVARIVSQAAKALGRAHQLGIVHRDIKPDNLFLLDLDGEPFVKVLDFGVAKHIAEGELAMTATGSVLGTPLYMSPEQVLSSKHVDFHADLWGLGVVAYRALTGQFPFSGETFGALSVALHSGVFAPPSHVRPGLPPAVDAWMQRALQTMPELRFGSAKELAEALEMAVFGAPRASFASGGEIAASSRSPGAERLSQSGSMNRNSGHGAAGVAQHAQGGVPGRTLGGMASTGSAVKRRVPVVGIAGAALASVALVGTGVYLGASERVTGDPAAFMANASAAAPSASAAEPSADAAGPAVSAAPDAAATPPVVPAPVPAAETTPVAPAMAAVSPAASASATPAPVTAPAAKATSAPRLKLEPSLPAGAASATAKPPTRKPAKDTIGF
ncbi:serine/threonine-protein kinase [Sorangium sp. So ce448]|uniref:serine/threonine-protein kinase n=1 Tax=Sorangium sp. So ce448 TaxID=3133314 RepID=UPI003F63C2F4